MRQTAQRLEILKLLKNDRTHPTAAQIYSRLKKRLPSVSFATVYNNLEKMARAGKLLEINSDPLRKRFDPYTKPHSHFFCISCGKVFDILKQLKKPSLKNFEVMSFSLEIKGLCPSCKRKKKTKGGKNGR